MKLALTVLLFIYMLPAMGQSPYKNGFVVTKNGDRIEGAIKSYVDKDEYIRFEFIDEENHAIPITTREIDYFKMGNSLYIRKKIRMPRRFLKKPHWREDFIQQVLTGEKATVFKFIYAENINSASPLGDIDRKLIFIYEYYLWKPDGTFLRINDMKFRKVLLTFFADNEEIIRNIKRRKWGYKDIPMMVATYNRPIVAE